MYKLSYYNFLIQDSGRFYLLYNSLYNGLYEISKEQFDILQKFEKKEKIQISDLNILEDSFKTMLFENHFLIDKSFDERSIIRKREQNIKKSFYDKKKITLTLIPTNSCNLDCIYCFEGEKQHKGLAKEEIFDSLIDRLEKEIITKDCVSLYVTWYGGEPTMGMKIIDKYTPLLLNLTEQKGLVYGASMITNGILLNAEKWEILSKNKITKVQITIDGNEQTHNALRPHVDKRKNSYEMIMNALQFLPNNIDVTIRINCDKKVVRSLTGLLQDLDHRGIWPHKAKQIKLKVARMIDYPNSRINKSDILTEREFMDISENFRVQLYQYACGWAGDKNIKLPKLLFRYPDLSSFFCATTHYPYGFAMDQYGFLYKCWNYVNEPKHRLHHIDSSYREIFKNHQCLKLLNYSKLSHEDCMECKFLPVCNSNCPFDRLDNRKQCCEWKYYLNDFFVRQYRLYLSNPSSMVLKQQVI
jgi:uncharacterized protein